MAASAARLLTRPALGPGVPATIQRNPLGNSAALALLLLDAPILEAHECRCSRKKLASSCQAALTRWINERTQGLRCLRPKFELRIGQHDYAPLATAEAHRALVIVWYADYVGEFIVGPQVERLERAKKGLGLAALQALAEYGWRSFPAMLCQHQLSAAEWFLWGGEGSIEDYIASLDLTADEAAEFRADSISETDIAATTPEWVLKSNRLKSPSGTALRRIERCSGDPLARAVAKILRMLAQTPKLPDPHEDLSDDGGFCGFAAYVRWSADDYTLDIAERIADDYLNSGIGYEICGIHEQSLGDLKKFREWMRRMDALFAVTRLLDRLLWLLSDAHYNTEQAQMEQTYD